MFKVPLGHGINNSRNVQNRSKGSYELVHCTVYTYLRSVAHVGRELYEATVALKVFRVPGLIHGSHAVLTLTEYF